MHWRQVQRASSLRVSRSFRANSLLLPESAVRCFWSMSKRPSGYARPVKSSAVQVQQASALLEHQAPGGRRTRALVHRVPTQTSSYARLACSTFNSLGGSTQSLSCSTVHAETCAHAIHCLRNCRCIHAIHPQLPAASMWAVLGRNDNRPATITTTTSNHQPRYPTIIITTTTHSRQRKKQKHQQLSGKSSTQLSPSTQTSSQCPGQALCTCCCTMGIRVSTEHLKAVHGLQPFACAAEQGMSTGTNGDAR
jgi:hypothetical protein